MDASALIRFYKCDGLEHLPPTVKLVVVDRVHEEIGKGGPSQRAALKRLDLAQHAIATDSLEWTHLAQVRGRFGTADLGEDASLAFALAQADRGHVLPFVVYDDGATRKAQRLGVATLSFLETLAWLVQCGVLTVDEAEAIEQRASLRDGWRRPAAQAAPLVDQLETLVGLLGPRIEAAQARVPAQRRR